MKIDYTLYLVTDQKLIVPDKLPKAVEQAILGGCTMIQLRDKTSSSNSFYQQAKAIKTITDYYHVPLIINDRIDIALAVGAAGVHLGQQDLPAFAARKIIRSYMLLGVSATTVKEAVQAQQAGADYIGVGAMYPTDTKSDAALVTLKELKHIRSAVSKPIVAIGGIHEEQAELLSKTGIHGIAVVSAILSSPDIQSAAKRLRKQFEGRKDNV